MSDADRLAEVRRVPGIVGYLLLDAAGMPTAGAGSMLASPSLQTSIATIARELYALAAATVVAPTSIFVRYTNFGMYVQRYAYGTLVVICSQSVSLAKLAFATNISLGFLSHSEASSAAPHLEPIAPARPTLAVAVPPTRVSAPAPVAVKAQPVLAGSPKRKTKLGIWD